MGRVLDEITAVRFYWTAHGIITGRCGHATRGPKWTFWSGLREIAKSLQRLHRGELKATAPQTRKAPIDVRDFVNKL